MTSVLQPTGSVQLQAALLMLPLRKKHTKRLKKKNPSFLQCPVNEGAGDVSNERCVLTSQLVNLQEAGGRFLVSSEEGVLAIPFAY